MEFFKLNTSQQRALVAYSTLRDYEEADAMKSEDEGKVTHWKATD